MKYNAMGWIKAQLSDKWHAKLKHYRDETGADDLKEAVVVLVQSGLRRYEDEHGERPEEYDKPDHPTWNND